MVTKANLDYDHQIRMAIIGNQKSGKSSLKDRFTKG